MKQCRKTGKLGFICLSVLFLLLFFNSTAYAVTSESQKVIAQCEMREWDNGAKVAKTSSGTGGNYQESVTADTNGLNKGYYSIYLYDITARNIKPYDGICFNFKNKNNADLKINLTFTADSKTSVTMNDSSYAILESADLNTRKAIVPAYGTISIPANFDGTVYVPFSKLYTSDGKNISLSHIQSWGITTVMSENQQIQYQIGNIAFLSGSVASMKDSYYLITLSGSSKIALPDTGSKIEFYQAKVRNLDGNPVNENTTFFLKTNVAGVKISKDGELEIGSGCFAANITVCAKTGKSVNCGELAVSLQRGSAAAYSAGIPKASDVPKITTPADVKLNEFVNMIRSISLVIALIFGVIFYNWFSEAKANFIKIRNKLYKTSNDHKEEETL